MTAPTPGWYPDPQDPRLMRWWDGGTWTPDVYERVEPVGGYLQPHGAAPGRAEAVPGPVASTEDGVPLAAWWARVAARIIDGLVTGVLALVLTFPVVRDVLATMWDDALTSAQAGGESATSPLLGDPQVLKSLAVITFVQLLVSLGYEMAFLLWKAATPGKLALGLQVRPWVAGERLSATTVAKRWLGYQGAQAVPYVGTPYVVIDVLWPLRDPRRQALHDKLARTCVVNARAARSR